MACSWRGPGDIAEVYCVSWRLYCDWTPDRSFSVDCNVLADLHRDAVCGVARMPRRQAGKAFPQSLSCAMKLQKEKRMATKIFVNLPVTDLNKSIEFFNKLGFTF